MRWLFIGILLFNVAFLVLRLTASSAPAGPLAARLASNPASTTDRGATSPALELLSESPAQPLAEPLHSGGVKTGVSPVKLCPAVGFGGNPELAAAYVDQLELAGIGAAVMAEGAQDATARYWVFLPPPPERMQSVRRLRELQAKGIDSFIVASGPDTNAISLGSFANRDSAFGLQARLVTAGYPAEVRRQEGQSEIRWAVLSEPGVQGYLEYIPQALRASTTVSLKQCPSP